jgi:HEAT repeat protein
MPRRRRTIALIAIAWVLVALIALFWPSREPLHKGKPVSYWIYRAFRAESSEDDFEEVQLIGAPAVPYLIAKLRVRDTLPRSAAIALWQSLPKPLWARIHGNFPELRPDRLHFAATCLLARIGKDARPAVPDLIHSIENDSDAFQAIDALGAIGPDAKDALPALHSALTNGLLKTRPDIAFALWSVGRETNAALQICIAAIQSTNTQAQCRGAILLGEMGLAARQTAPFLAQVLDDPTQPARLRACAATALGKLGLKTEPVLSALRAAMLETNRNPNLAINSAIALWGLDNWQTDSRFVLTALKLRIHAFQSGIPGLVGKWDFISEARDCGFDARAATPALTDLLNDPDHTVRARAAEALHQINSTETFSMKSN